MTVTVTVTVIVTRREGQVYNFNTVRFKVTAEAAAWKPEMLGEKGLGWVVHFPS